MHLSFNFAARGMAIALVVAFSLGFSMPAAHADNDILKGTIIGAGIGSLAGGHGARNGAIIGAVAGGIKRNNDR